MATRVLWLTKGLGPGGTERLLVEMAGATDRLEPTVAYVVPWKDHLAGELEEVGVTTVCLSARRRDPRWPLHLRRVSEGANKCRLTWCFASGAFAARRLVPADFEPFVDNPWTLGRASGRAVAACHACRRDSAALTS